MRWISQNWEHYHEPHLVALVEGSGVGGGSAQVSAHTRRAHLVAQVRALYDAP